MTYLWGVNPVYRESGSDTSYYLYNAHGDVVQLANASGAITTTYDYDAFGNEVDPALVDANPLRYCGEYFDTETGTYDLHARCYDHTDGCFS